MGRKANRRGRSPDHRILGARDVGAYQLQAAIAALHDEAPVLESTDWAQILALYELLLRLGENPGVRLNHAVALAMVRRPQAGLAQLDRLQTDNRIADDLSWTAGGSFRHLRSGLGRRREPAAD